MFKITQLVQFWQIKQGKLENWNFLDAANLHFAESSSGRYFEGLRTQSRDQQPMKNYNLLNRKRELENRERLWKKSIVIPDQKLNLRSISKIK